MCIQGGAVNVAYLLCCSCHEQNGMGISSTPSKKDSNNQINCSNNGFGFFSVGANIKNPNSYGTIDSLIYNSSEEKRYIFTRFCRYWFMKLRAYDCIA